MKTLTFILLCAALILSGCSKQPQYDQRYISYPLSAVPTRMDSWLRQKSEEGWIVSAATYDSKRDEVVVFYKRLK